MNDKFLELIRKLFLISGIDIDGRFQSRPRIARFLSIWRRFIPVFIIVGVFQIWIKIIFFPSGDSINLTTFLLGMLGLHVIFKLYMMNKHNAEMMTQLSQIHEFHTINYGQLHTKSEKLLKFIYRQAYSVIVLTLISCQLIYISLITHLLFDAIQGVETEIQFLFQLYLPFAETDHRIFVTFYTMALQNSISVSTFVVNNLATYTVTYLSICFDRLTEEFREVINGSDARAFRETKKMLAAFIDKHNQLIEICEKVNSIYGTTLLIFTVQVSMLICMMGFHILVSVFFRLESTLSNNLKNSDRRIE
jgi:hypothetical protein